MYPYTTEQHYYYCIIYTVMYYTELVVVYHQGIWECVDVWPLEPRYITVSIRFTRINAMLTRQPAIHPNIANLKTILQRCTHETLNVHFVTLGYFPFIFFFTNKAHSFYSSFVHLPGLLLLKSTSKITFCFVRCYN